MCQKISASRTGAGEPGGAGGKREETSHKGTETTESQIGRNDCGPRGQLHRALGAGVLGTIVHRFGEFKRLARHAPAPMLTDQLRRGADSNAKADPTPFFYRGVHDRSRTVVEEMIKTSVAAEVGFVESSVLPRDYHQAVAGTPEPYDIWWFLTMEMWLRKFWDS